MAIIENPNGKPRGRFGTAIFYDQFGRTIMRSIPLDVKNPRTPAQLYNRGKFKKYSQLASFMNPFIKRTFLSVSTNITQFNLFSRVNHAAKVVTGDYPDFVYDYSKMIVSMGNLRIAEGGIIKSVTDKKIIFTWNDNSGGKYSHISDIASVLLINEDKKSRRYYESNATRIDETMEIVPPENWINNKLHVYFMFKDRQHELFSDSLYLGNVSLAEGSVDASQATDVSNWTVRIKKAEDKFPVEGVVDGMVKIKNGNRIIFKWKGNSNGNNSRPEDKAVALIINTTKNCVKQYFGPATRIDSALEVIAPDDWINDNIKTYLSFKENEKDEFSESFFMGDFTLSKLQENKSLTKEPAKFDPINNQIEESKPIIKVTANFDDIKDPEDERIQVKSPEDVIVKKVQNKILFEWRDNSTSENSNPTDKALLILINKTKNSIRYYTGATTRKDTKLKITAPPDWLNDDIHATLSFKDANSELFSNNLEIPNLLS